MLKQALSQGGGIPEIAGTILARDFKGVNTFDMEEGKYAVCAEISPTVTNDPPFSRTGNERVECDALVTYGIQGNMIGRADTAGPQGNGFSQEIGYTLTKTDVHGVATLAPPHVFKIRGGCEGGGKGYLGQDEQAFTILTGSDQQVAVPIAIATKQIGQNIEYDIANTLAANDYKEPQAVATQYAVRRLTPVECARLQGFPDDYLDIQWRNKPAGDGVKYKALGNSWAVPVVRWIGQRIQESLK